MKAIAICPRCNELVSTDDPLMVDQGESFHACRKGDLRWVKVEWRIEPENDEERKMLEDAKKD
jgi:hypothetical protein